METILSFPYQFGYFSLLSFWQNSIIIPLLFRISVFSSQFNNCHLALVFLTAVFSRQSNYCRIPQLFWIDVVFDSIQILPYSLLPSKYFSVFKTPWRQLQDMSWRGLQYVFKVTIFRLPRRLEDMSWRHLEDMSWRRLEDVAEANKMFTGDIYLTNLNALFRANLYLTNLRRIQNALIRTQ